MTTPILAFLLTFASASPAVAGCVSSLVQAAARHGVPPDLMLALGHAESRWNAYAVNSAGASHFPESAAAAVALVRSEQARGVASIDVGCGQINLRWHTDAFADLADAFDPERNAEYAAWFLADLKASHGNWPAAVAHYHSSDPKAQQTYLSRITQRLAVLQNGAPPDYFSTMPVAPPPQPASQPVEAPKIRPIEPGESGTRTVQPRIVGVQPAGPGDSGGRVIPVPGLR